MILAGMMAVNAGSAVFAESEMPGIEGNMKFSYDAVFSYAQKILPGHLSMFDYDSAHVEISNVYPLNSLQNTGEGLYLCFALENGRIIGELTVAELPGGEFTSTFDLCSYPEVDEAAAKGEPIGFYSDDGALYFMTNHSLTIIDRDAISESQPGIIARQANKVSLTKMESKPISGAYDVYGISSTANPLYKCKYEVKIVKNPTNTNYNKGNGICWAACVASKVRYEIVSYHNKELTAEEVYDATEAANNDGVGEGKERYQKGLAVYGITANDNKDNRVLPFSELHNKMKNGNLVIMRLKRDGGSHAVVLSGYQIFSEAEGGYYYIMDPNKTRMMSVSVSGNQYKTGENIHYKPGSDRDYTWFDSMYTK